MPLTWKYASWAAVFELALGLGFTFMSKYELAQIALLYAIIFMLLSNREGKEEL